MARKVRVNPTEAEKNRIREQYPPGSGAYPAKKAPAPSGSKAKREVVRLRDQEKG